MKRDKDFIQKNTYVKDGKIYCKQKTIIEFPKWYEDKGLAAIQEVTNIYGIFAIIIGDSYSVSLIPTLINTTPIMVNQVTKEGIDYYQFVYGKDDVLINNVRVVKKELLSYNFFETFYMYARAPWYVEYEDLVRIMDNLPKYAKSNIGDNYISNELVTSFITRNLANRRLYYRQVQKGEYEYVDLMSPYFSATSVVNKIGGNQFQDALISAINQKETKITKLEEIVRK